MRRAGCAAKDDAAMTISRRLVFSAVLAVVGSSVLLLFLEGLSSVAYVARRFRINPYTEHYYCDFDPELGWLAIPGARLPDAFGPGLGVSINERGFRGTAPTKNEVPAGKIRLIATGDSFTFGTGVKDTQTFPYLMSQLEPRLDVVNMGQAEYGVDQAYLWFLKETQELDYDIHLFCFIGDDFDRATAPEYSGYPKPLLRVRDGELAAVNTPLPRPWPLMVHWRRNRLVVMNQLRLLRAFRMLFSLTPPKRTSWLDDPPSRQAAEQIVSRLARLARERNDLVILVRLPTVLDFRPVRKQLPQQAIRQFADRAGIPLFDLATEFQALSPDEDRGLFIQPKESHVQGVVGHYSPRGHEVAASSILERLLGLPEIQERLKKLGAEGSPATRAVGDEAPEIGPSGD